MLNPSR